MSSDNDEIDIRDTYAELPTTSLVILVVYCVIFSVLIVGFLARRNVQPIKSRSAGLVAISACGSAMMVIYSLTRLLVGREDFLCAVYLFGTAWVPISGAPYCLRSWRLYALARFQRRLLTPNDIKDDEDKNAGVALPLLGTKSLDWFKSTRYATDARFLFKIFAGMTVGHVVVTLIMFVSFGQFQDKTRGCSFNDELYIFSMETLIYFILIAMFYRLLRDTSDAFSITTELRLSLLVWLVHLTFFFGINMHESTFIKVEQQFPTVYILVAMAIETTFISVGWPLFLSFRETGFQYHQRDVSDLTTSFKGLFNDPLGRDYFRKYLAQEFALENLLFWEAVQRFKGVDDPGFGARDAVGILATPQSTTTGSETLDDSRSVVSGGSRRDIGGSNRGGGSEPAASSSPDDPDDMARFIWDRYVSPDAELEINVSAQVRDGVRSNVYESGRISRETCFKEAEEAVFEMMERDSFARFRTSDVYAEFAKQVKAEGEVVKVLEEVGMV